jgi:hypothetical protein
VGEDRAADDGTGFAEPLTLRRGYLGGLRRLPLPGLRPAVSQQAGEAPSGAGGRPPASGEAERPGAAAREGSCKVAG